MKMLQLWGGMRIMMDLLRHAIVLVLRHAYKIMTTKLVSEVLMIFRSVLVLVLRCTCTTIVTTPRAAAKVLVLCGMM
jgi:hypothetical protein